MSCMNACSYEMHTITLELHNQTQAPNGIKTKIVRSQQKEQLYL